MPLPFWAMFLIQTAIKLAVPELEKHMQPALVDLLNGIISAVKASDDPEKKVTDLNTHFNAMGSVANASDTKSL